MENNQVTHLFQNDLVNFYVNEEMTQSRKMEGLISTMQFKECAFTLLRINVCHYSVCSFQSLPYIKIIQRDSRY